MKDFDTIKLLAKELGNETTPQEKEQIAGWIDQSPDNKSLYNELTAVWENSAPPKMVSLPDKAAEWNRLSERLAISADKKRFTILRFLQTRLRPALVAGLAVLLIFISIYAWKNLVHQNEWQQISVPNGRRASVTLSDGSVVKINSGSTLRFLRSFPDSVRQIFLNGEAFFAVQKDGRPFIVQTANALITVLGTKFNVRSRDSLTRVRVYRGQVKLARILNDSNFVVLTKGRESEVFADREPIPPRNIKINTLPGWINGKLDFVKASL
ncbi:MAG: hypothetical protein GXO75_16520, partial [Calditrichaeota bacterium]|nr:hypothetical protein [Calditrichota bacterium]